MFKTKYPPVTRICQECGKPFLFKPRPSAILEGRGKLCGRECTIAYNTRRMHGNTYAAGRTGPRPEMRGRHLNKGPQIQITCANCGKVFEVPPNRAKTAKYCCHRCMSDAKKKVTGTAHPLYKLIEMKCEHCGKVCHVKPAKAHEFRYCSRTCHGYATALKYPRTTTIETAVHIALDEAGIQHTQQHQVGYFVVDLAIPELRIAIETDGDYWHGTDKQKKKDAVKDGYLRHNGWVVIRLPEHEIRRDVNTCLDKIKAVIAERQSPCIYS